MTRPKVGWKVFSVAYGGKSQFWRLSSSQIDDGDFIETIWTNKFGWTFKSLRPTVQRVNKDLKEYYLKPIQEMMNGQSVLYDYITGKEMTRVEVTWIDSATGTVGWSTRQGLKDEMGPSEIKSVGYVFHQDNKHITLVQSQSNSSGNFMNDISIPTKCISKIKELH